MRSVPVFVAIAVVLTAVPSGAVPESNEPPVVDAGLDQTVERGHRVFLDGGGSYDPEGDPLSYRWSVETPTGSTLEPTDPEAKRTSFVAAETGRYYVTLTVTDDSGNSHSDTLYVDAESVGDDGGGVNATDPPERVNDPPTGEIVGPDSIVRGTIATFTANAYDPDGGIHSYEWSIGGEGRTVRRTFSEPVGSRVTISVLVEDDDGATTRLTKSVTVVDEPDEATGGASGNTPPTVDIDGPTRVGIGESVTFLLSASDGDGTVVGRTWTAPVRGSGSTLTHSYDSPGTYTVTARVVDEDGASATTTHEVEVYGSGEPVVSISGPDTAPSGSTQRYTLSAHDPDGGPLTIDWNPGQTQLERGATRFENVVTIDSLPGETMSVSATVTDDEGNSVTVVKNTKVQALTGDTAWSNNPLVMSEISASALLDNSNQQSISDTIEAGTYLFRVDVKNHDGEYVIVKWSFNDGTTFTDHLGRYSGSKISSIEHQFVSDNGSLKTGEVFVEATDASGNRTTRRWVGQVQTVAGHPHARLGASFNGHTIESGGTLNVGTGALVQFYAFSEQQFRMEFGDGTTQQFIRTTEFQTIIHKYNLPGVYTVQLTSIQGDDGYATKRLTVIVEGGTYTEYWYNVQTSQLERTISASRPQGDRWSKVKIDHAERYYTGNTITYRSGTGYRLDLGDEWVITDTYTEQRPHTDTTIRQNDPDGSGTEWTLRNSRVQRETHTTYEDQYRWLEGRYGVPGWSRTGETRTQRVVIGDGHDHDRTRHTDYDRTSCADRSLVPSPDGSFDVVCNDWNYDRDVWYSGHDHDGYTSYDTDYRYHREVERTEEIWLHEYTRTTYETVQMTELSETASRDYWLWERTINTGYETEYSLTKPKDGSFVEGTLRLVTVGCRSNKSHFDSAMC